MRKDLPGQRMLAYRQQNYRLTHNSGQPRLLEYRPEKFGCKLKGTCTRLNSKGESAHGRFGSLQ